MSEFPFDSLPAELIPEEEEFNELARVVQEHPGDGRIARAKAVQIYLEILTRRMKALPDTESDFDPRLEPDDDDPGYLGEKFFCKMVVVAERRPKRRRRARPIPPDFLSRGKS